MLRRVVYNRYALNLLSLDPIEQGLLRLKLKLAQYCPSQVCQGTLRHVFEGFAHRTPLVSPLILADAIRPTVIARLVVDTLKR